MGALRFLGDSVKFKALIAGLAGSFILGSAATAADIPVIVPPAPPPIVVAAGPVAFDWSGVYAGVVVFPAYPIVVGQVGFNFVRGNFLVGVAGGGGVAIFQGPTFVLQGSARAGLLLGQRDRVLVFAEAITQGAPGLGFGFSFGGGVEVRLNDRLSVVGSLGLGYIATGLNFKFGG